MSVCNGCGCCCDPVMLPYTQLEAMTAPDIDPVQKAFTLEHLHPMTPKEAYEHAPWLRGLSLMDRRGELVFVPSFFRCDFFNEDTRQCEAYEQRPEMCKGYPFYGQAPTEADEYMTLPPPCSFRPDVGLTIIPLDEVRRR